MRIYLDNNATTPIHPEVLDTLSRALRDVYGNASSIHKEGQTARRFLEQARDAVAGLIHATPREIVFTSGGTESNNSAIFGAVATYSRCHIVTTAIEHPSVLETVSDLERRGAVVVTVVPSGSRGVVSADDVIAAIRPETRLVAMMLANNETGVLQPVAAVGAHCRERGIHLHCDAVQAAGKVSIDVNALAVDTLSLSAHKFHAPKGVGVLYVRGGLTLQPWVRGGAQERRRRAGTENVPLAAAMGRAAQIVSDLQPMRRVGALRERLEADLLARVPNAHVNSGGAGRLPNTSNICFSGSDSEAIVIGLDLDGVAVSSGSACSSGRVEPSRVLLAMGLSEEDPRSSLRISLSRFTTEQEVNRVVSLLEQLVPRNRREVFAANV